MVLRSSRRRFLFSRELPCIFGTGRMLSMFDKNAQGTIGGKWVALVEGMRVF